MGSYELHSHNDLSFHWQSRNASNVSNPSGLVPQDIQVRTAIALTRRLSTSAPHGQPTLSALSFIDLSSISRCESCGYYCTLPLGIIDSSRYVQLMTRCRPGHPQQEHETSHGSMSQTRWAVDGPDGTSLELRGRKYSSNDDGAPMMCNLVCLAMGRHVHIDYCRTQDGIPCDAAEVQHIPTRIIPDPGRLKDFVTHSLHWRRTGMCSSFEVVLQNLFYLCRLQGYVYDCVSLCANHSPLRRSVSSG